VILVLFFDNWVNKNNDLIRVEELDYQIENNSEMKLLPTEEDYGLDCGIKGRKMVFFTSVITEKT